MKRRARPDRFHSILCPIDFSADARRALRSAFMLARRWRSRLCVFYAVDPMLASAAAVALNDPTLRERSDKGMRAFVEASLKGRSNGGPAIKYVTRVGRPADEVLRAADRERADLIVLGTHGMTGAGKLIMGSTTEAVLRRALIPVLAIPGRLGGTRRLPENWPGNLVVAALNIDDRSYEVAARAANIARLLDARLLLVHVVPLVQVPAWMHAARTAYGRIELDKASGSLERVAARVRRDYERVDAQILHGTPGAEIAALVTQKKAGLVITLLDKNGGWFGSRRGSLSYQLLADAHVPLLALP